jgi:hypothetical protein
MGKDTAAGLNATERIREEIVIFAYLAARFESFRVDCRGKLESKAKVARGT